MTRRRTRPARPRHRGEGGFTILELLVATMLLGLVVGMTLQLAYTMLEGYRTQRAAQAVERNARGALDLISKAVRAASTGVVTGDLRDAAACTDVVGISVVNSSTGPDQLSVIYGVPGGLTSTRGLVNGTTSSFDVTDSTGLATGDLVIITNGDAGRVYPVTNLSGNSITTSTGGCAGMTMPDFAAGALVVRARVAVFSVAEASDGTPMLMMDPDGDGAAAAEPVAEGIEDFQVAIGADTDGDGALADAGDANDEWFGNHAGDAAPPTITNGEWRAIRITIVARDVAAGIGTVSAPPAAEDHAEGSADGYRRRVLTTTAEIRNFIEGTP